MTDEAGEGMPQFHSTGRMIAFITLAAVLLILTGRLSFSARDQKAAVVAAFSELTETYTDADSGFAFQYPAGFEFYQLTWTEDGQPTAEITVFEKPTGQSRFQLSISDGTEPVTPERIMESLEGNIRELKAVAIAGEEGVSFLDASAEVPGDYRQVWFTANGKLYQITAEPSFDSSLESILSTWRFTPANNQSAANPTAQ